MTTPADTARRAILGMPYDPAKKPEPRLTVQAFDEMWQAVIANMSGAIIRATRAALYSMTTAAAHQMAWVTQDTTTAYNGIYENTGLQESPNWTRRADLPYAFIATTNAGAGSANSIVAASTLPVPSVAGRALMSVNITHTNTGATVMAVAGDTPKSFLTAAGNPMPAGTLVAGMMVWFVFDGTAYRLMSGATEAALDAAAEAAGSAAAAEAALEEMMKRLLGPYADDAAATAAAILVGGQFAGQIYWNTASSEFRNWDGDSWEAMPYATVVDGGITEQKLDPALAAVIVPRTSSLTINVPTDYASVQLAMEAASMIRFKTGRIAIINIESGHLITTPMEFLNTDFGGLTINSEDSIVGIDDSFPKIFPAARWDGAGTRSRRAAALVGVTDGKKGTVSFWAKFNGGDSSTLPLIMGRQGADIAFTVRRSSAGIWQIQGRSTPAGTLVLSMASNSVWNVADGWHHVLASWDLAAGQAQLYVNDVDDRAAAPTVTNTAIDYTLSDWGFGCEPASAADPSLTFNGDLAEVYINLAESIDLSIEANRRKFRQASGAPEVLGKFATRPTGTRPALYFGGVYQSFRINKGSGGAFTNSGTFAPAPTYPDGTSAGEAAGDGAHILSLRNCAGLVWNILVDGDSHAFQGMDLYRSDIQIGGTGKGIKNCLEDNIEANKGSRVTARDGIFSGAGYRGIQADGGSYVDAVGVNVSECLWGLNAQNGSLIDGSPEGGADSPVNATGCYDRAVIADELARITLWQADLTGCGGTYCVEISSGAHVYLESARTNNSGALVGFFYKPSLTDINVAAFNTLYHNGVVFAPTWDA